MLENKARASVVPESAEEAGVSANEMLEVNIAIESRGCFRCSVRDRSSGIDSGLGDGFLEELRDDS